MLKQLRSVSPAARQRQQQTVNVKFYDTAPMKSGRVKLDLQLGR